MRLKLLVLLVLCGVSVQGCGGDDDSGAGGTVSVGTGGTGGRRDGGGIPFFPMGARGGSDDEDGGSDEDGGAGSGGNGGMGGTGGAGGADAGDMGSRCLDVDPVPIGTDPDPEMLYSTVTTPTDLVVTRAEAAWEIGCGQPTLRVSVSSGRCPTGDGHDISFFIPANGIEDGTVVLGQNLIMEESAPGMIRVRYTRPTRLEPNGQWGTCEDAGGTLDFIGELELVQDRKLQGSFTIDLTRCDDGQESVQPIQGSFNVEIPATLDDICP